MPNVYEIVTEQVVKMLETGITAPWKKPWSCEPPVNLISQKPYNGLNTWLLGIQGFGSKYFLTYAQAQKLGGNIKAGAKSTMVVFWKPMEFKRMNPETQELENRCSALLRYSNVFNLSQTEGIAEKLGLSVDSKRIADVEACEAIVRAMPNPPNFEQHHRAAYIPAKDTILMPERAAFQSVENFYATNFHELVHSTGHASRLARPGIEKLEGFGTESYSKEELIAELGASMLCGLTGIAPAVIGQSASYLANWVKVLKGDSKLIVSASSAAQKAADYIRGVHKMDEVDRQ